MLAACPATAAPSRLGRVRFADYVVLAGPQAEVSRSMDHLQQFMPALGVRFSKADLVPAVPASPALDEALAFVCGACIRPGGNFEPGWRRGLGSGVGS